MEVYHSNDIIYFKDAELNGLGQTNYTDELWTIVSNIIWSIKKKPDGSPQYLVSGKLKKSLHQVVVDYFFGEDVRKCAYEKNMVIEHLNNNGFDCKISNLYFLLDVKNKYKGNYLDKFIKESIPVASLNIFHIIANKTFQITIAFNEFFTNEKGELIEVMKLKYNCDYCTVLQDAEKILEDIVCNRRFSMSELKKHYRFSDYRIRYSENLTLK